MRQGTADRGSKLLFPRGFGEPGSASGANGLEAVQIGYRGRGKRGRRPAAQHEPSEVRDHGGVVPTVRGRGKERGDSTFSRETCPLLAKQRVACAPASDRECARGMAVE